MKPKSLASVKSGADIGHYSPIKTDPKQMGLAVALICLCGAWRPHITCIEYTDHPVLTGKVEIISVGRNPAAKFNKVLFERNRPDRFFIEVKESHYHLLSQLFPILEGLYADAYQVCDQPRIGISHYLFCFEGDRIENLLAVMDHFREII